MRKQLITIGAAAILALSGVAALHAQRGGPGGRGPDGPSGPGVANQQPDANGGAPGAPGAPQGRGGRGGRGRAGGGPGGPGARGGGPAMGGPNLTDEQRTKVEAIVRTSRDQAAPFVDQLVLARKQLHREAFAEKRDAGKIATLENSVATLEKQVLDVRVKAKASISDILTAEQRETIRANGEWFPGGDGPGRGPGGPAGRGPARRN